MPDLLDKPMRLMGFVMVAKHRSKDVVLYHQGDINFIINREPKSPAGYFSAEHGSSACGMDAYLLSLLQPTSTQGEKP